MNPSSKLAFIQMSRLETCSIVDTDRDVRPDKSGQDEDDSNKGLVFLVYSLVFISVATSPA